MSFQCSRLATSLLALLLLLSLTACGPDPLGPDNRMALIALGRCESVEALTWVAAAKTRGSDQNVYQSLLLNAAILLEHGETAAAEALYPAIEAQWRAMKGRSLSPDKRDRTIDLFLAIVRDERVRHGLGENCEFASKPLIISPPGDTPPQ